MTSGVTRTWQQRMKMMMMIEMINEDEMIDKTIDDTIKADV